jgi:hypothetical protein
MGRRFPREGFSGTVILRAGYWGFAARNENFTTMRERRLAATLAVRPFEQNFCARFCVSHVVGFPEKEGKVPLQSAFRSCSVVGR